LKAIYSAKSNEQRLKSLNQYDEERKQRKRLIKDSLNKSDAKKHVKFDSDDDDDVKGKEFVEKKLQLFDNDDGVNIDEHFNPSQATKTKRKLKSLQSKVSNTTDPRFQLSEQFLDEKVREEEEKEEEEEEKGEISFEEEKKKSLAILDQITNAKTSASSTIKSKSKSKMIRFDPSKTEHRIYELESEVPINGNHSSPTKETTKETSMPVVDATRVYEFDKTKLKSIFDKTTKPVETSIDSTQFQFQFFHTDPTPSTPSTFSTEKSISNGKAKTLTANLNDSSSEDEEEKTTSNNGVEETVENRTFFFFDIDHRLKDGLETFVRTDDLNELERNWPTKRKEIGEALRTKHRKALARKDKHRISKHRYRQTTKST